MKTWRVVGPLISLALVASGCTGGSPKVKDGSHLVLPSPLAVNATTAPLLPTGRFELPEIDFNGFQALLQQLEGTPVVVNMWGSWCGPCRKEAPVLARTARAFDRRIQFLGIDIEDRRTDARVFIRDFGWPYPSVFDPSRAVLTGLGFLGPPITLVFDRRGRRVGLFTGPIDQPRDLARVLRRIV